MLYRGATYREAGVQDVVRAVLSRLWRWMYLSGTTKQQVLSWFREQGQKLFGRRATLIDSELVEQIANLLATKSLRFGDFMLELERQLDSPPQGYRWKKNEDGSELLIKTRSKIDERTVVQGKRFAGKVLLSAWWITKNPRGAASRRMQKLCNEHGGVFLNKKVQGGREYGAFCVANQHEAAPIARQMCALVDRLRSEAGREQDAWLGGISLEAVAENRGAKPSDTKFVDCIRSSKFNWYYTLVDLLNGRIAEYKNSAPLDRLIKQLREAK